MLPLDQYLYYDGYAMHILLMPLLGGILAASAYNPVARTTWSPYSAYTAMSYGSSPATTTLNTSHQIYNATATCGDDDTYYDTIDINHTQLFHNTNYAISISVGGGVLLGNPNLSYDANTNKTTVTWTIQGPDLVVQGDQAIHYDQFSYIDNAPLPLTDAPEHSTNMVIWQFVPHAGGGGG